MSLFQKKEQANFEQPVANSQPTGTGLNLKILGSGCKKCQKLEENVRLATQELGIQASVEHVKDFEQIASYGVLSTPALVVNDKVASYGKVLTVAEAKEILQHF